MDASEPEARALVPAPARTPSLLGGLAARTLDALRASGAGAHGPFPLAQLDLSDALVYRLARSRNGGQAGRERAKVVEWLAAVDPDRQVILDMSAAIQGFGLRPLFRFLGEPAVRSRPFLFYIPESDLSWFSLELGEDRHSALAVVGPPLDFGANWSSGFPWVPEEEIVGLDPRRVEPVGLGSASFLAALDKPRIPSGMEPAGQWLVMSWLVSCIARECWFEPPELPPEPFEPQRPRWHGRGRQQPPTHAEREAWRQRHEHWEREHAAWEQRVREHVLCRVEPGPAEALPPPPDAGAHFFASGGNSSACGRYASPGHDHVDPSGHHWRFVPMSVPHAVCRECETALGLRPPMGDALFQQANAGAPPSVKGLSPRSAAPTDKT